MELLKIASSSNPSSVAGAIVTLVEQNKQVELHAIGAGAVNQAIKSIAIARGYVAPLGYNLACVPAFMRLNANGEEKTGIKLLVVKE